MSALGQVGDPVLSPAPPPMTRLLNVAYFTNALARGGAEEHLLGLLQSLDRRRFRPHLICPPRLAQALGAEVPNDVRVSALVLRSLRHARAAWQLATCLRTWKVDLLHSHLFYSSLFASPIGKACCVPVMVETPHVREHWRHGWKDQYLLDRIVGRAVDAYIAVSRANARYLIETKRLPAAKVTVIENGIEFAPSRNREEPRARLRRQLGIADEDRVLVVVGRLERQKGHAVLLRALPNVRRRFPRLHLVCIGAGSLRAALEEQAHTAGLAGHVHFVGFQRNVPEWLELADIVVLPSWFEGMPLVALEALAAGRPVVATAVDGTPEIVIAGRTGLTVPAGDSEALAAALLRLLRCPALGEQLGAEGRRLVFTAFTRQRQMERTEGLYMDLWRRSLARQRSPAARAVPIG